MTKITRRGAGQLDAGAVVGATLGGVLAPRPAGAPERDRHAFANRYSFRPGERITLAPGLDCVHLFDAHSGVNLMP
jgi:hypothetical protein